MFSSTLMPEWAGVGGRGSTFGAKYSVENHFVVSRQGHDVMMSWIFSVF